MSSSSGTCSTVDPSAASKEFMLFGVRVVVDSMRKSVSLNNLSQYEHLPIDASDIKNSSGKDEAVAGYASENDAAVLNSGGNRERKRGVPWTEEEHKLFLLGLQKVGKGYWRGISRNYVKTRTQTQVASHAQKYFLRRTNHNRRRRRSSLFDITTDSVPAIPMEEEQVQFQDNTSHSQQLPQSPRQAESCNPNGFLKVTNFAMNVGPVVEQVPNVRSTGNLTFGQGNAGGSSFELVRPVVQSSTHHKEVPAIPMEEEQVQFQDNTSHSQQLPQSPRQAESCNPNGFLKVTNFAMNVGPVVEQVPNVRSTGNLTFGQGNAGGSSFELVRPVVQSSTHHKEVPAIPMEEEQVQFQDNTSHSQQLPQSPRQAESCNPNGFLKVTNFAMNVGPVVEQVPNVRSTGNLTFGQGNAGGSSFELVRPVVQSSTHHKEVALNLSLSMNSMESSSMYSVFEPMSCFGKGDNNIIRVA